MESDNNVELKKVIAYVEYVRGDVVYIKTDSEQLPCLVLGYELKGEEVLYIIGRELAEWTLSNIELNKEKVLFS